MNRKILMNQLHQHVMQIGELVRDQPKGAVDALEKEDADAARQVIERDQLVNGLDTEFIYC